MFLLPISLFFFLFSVFLLLLLQSLIVRLTSELHGRRRDLYMMILFFSWCFRILSSFFFSSSSFFHFPMKLACHHHRPLLCHHRPRGGLASRRHVLVAPGRHATLCGGFSYCGAICGARSSRVVSTLMPECRLGRVTLTLFQPNVKTKKKQLLFTPHGLIHAPLYCFRPSPFLQNLK